MPINKRAENLCHSPPFLSAFLITSKETKTKHINTELQYKLWTLKKLCVVFKMDYN